jgi:tRNA(Ile)-lysidine synthase TilS/MesJ
MALVFLCHQLTVTHPRVPLEIHGLIVDHRARPESEDEAWKAKGSLWKLDISSRILTLPWPTVSWKMKNFETQARIRRYQAMGKACAEMEIEHLLLGHHQDDNVETILMRLANGAVGKGLIGLRATTTTIPCCDRVFHVHQSGRALSFETLKEETSRGLPTPPDADPFRAFPAQTPLEFSNGGVNIYRPLMPFTKSQLLSTCDFYRIPYQMDPSNFDRTLTPRNTIRSLLRERKLPRALQPSSLLSLAEKKESEYHHLEGLSKKLLEATVLERFDLQCAVLDVRPPSLDVLPSTLSFNEKLAVGTLYLRYLVHLLITPAESFQLNRLEPAVPNIFPDLRRPSDPPGPCHTFTACGLLWKREHKIHGLTEVQDSDTNLGSMWRIGCEPSKREQKNLFTSIPSLPPKKDTPFFLFESGSFWIRLKNLSKTHDLRDLLIRKLHPDDLSDIRGRLPPERRDFLDKLLERGEFRFQLPVVAQLRREEGGGEEKELSEDAEGCSEGKDPRGQENEQEGRKGKDVEESRGRVICFPTFGLSIPNIQAKEADKLHSLLAEVRYRKIDLEVLRLLLQKSEVTVADGIRRVEHYAKPMRPTKVVLQRKLKRLETREREA